jgi:hypothetical protein
MKGWMTGLLALPLLIGGVGPASASIVQVLTPAGLDPGDTTATYPGVDGSTFPNGGTVTAAGTTLTFTDANAQPFLRVDQGNTWTPGAYPNGTKLLWNFDPATNTAGGPVTINLTPGVGELGLSLQQDDTHAGTTTFTFQGFNGATAGPTFTVTSVNDANPPNGNLSFVGLQGTAGDVITRIVISSSDTSSFGTANDFVLGPVTFGPPAASVPEPSPLALGSLCTLGLLVLGGRSQWRRRTVAVAA